jgi:hypothetical protein
MNENLYQLLSELNTESSRIRAEFHASFDPDLDTIPIPFFGDLLGAKVITVGLNPSDGEIRGRGWFQPISAANLYERLVYYFNNPQFDYHPWFNIWERALGKIGVSYIDGTAAHVDLCPWATKPMSNLPDHDRFVLLVDQSLSWFWRCIQMAANLRLVLMAGAVSKKYYLNEFLRKTQNYNGNALIGKVSRSGKAFVGCHQLSVSGKKIPVFFCSVSPSSRTSAMLPLRVSENRDCLVKFLA